MAAARVGRASVPECASPLARSAGLTLCGPSPNGFDPGARGAFRHADEPGAAPFPSLCLAMRRAKAVEGHCTS